MIHKVNKIKMSSLLEDVERIEQLELSGPIYNGWYRREDVYDRLYYGHTIKVNVSPYPELVEYLSFGTKYVKSKSNGYSKDNLLILPRG